MSSKITKEKFCGPNCIATRSHGNKTRVSIACSKKEWTHFDIVANGVRVRYNGKVARTVYRVLKKHFEG